MIRGGVNSRRIMRRFSVRVALVTMLSLGALASAGPAAAAPPEFFGLAPQAPPPSADIQRMGQGKVG
ncbi:MAG: hypothetical protein ACRDL1_12225, partial [Solirubrobacterales bacterium]